MVKKVKKYVKSVLCVVLMLSLVMPMYAANEASDPSAFVTKEEFDKALADFNQRLSTFEAGINSKIDSQVTSYLDRNGIWSGKEQDLLDIAKGGDLTKMANSWFKKIYNSGETTSYWKRIDGLHGSWTTEQYKVIDKCTKTGLLYLTWRVDGRDATETISQKYAHGTYYFHKEANAQYEAFCFIGLGFTRKENNVDIATWYNVQTVLLSQLEGTDGAKNSGGYVWSQPYHGGTSMFFVETGDPVFFGIIATSDAGASCWVFCSTNNNTSCQTPVFLHVMDAKVY